MAAGLDHVDVDLAVVVDPNVELAQKTANRYGYRTASADLQAVLDDPSIDAVSVALPNSAHAEVLPAVLASGKHVLTEKPIGRSATEAAPLAAAAEQSAAITGVGFSFRRLPGLAAVHDLVSDGAIGDVQSFTACYNADYGSSPDAPFSWRYAKDTAGAGALIDIGTHAIDTVQHVVGPIRRVVSATLQTVITRRPIPGSSDFGTVDTDDIALLTVELENGAIGQIHASRVAVGIPNSLGLQVHGSPDMPDSTPSLPASSTCTSTTVQRCWLVPVASSPGPRTPTSPTWPRCPAAVSAPGTPRRSSPRSSTSCAASSPRGPMDTSFASALRVMRVVDAAIEAADTQSAVVIAEPAHA